jgi:F-type H+-transporting ATPase subunit b
MFLSLDGTFWVQLVNFAIFIAILNVVFLRPVGAAIKKRRAYIDSVRGDLERHEKEALALRAAAEQKRVAARRAAEEAVVRARAEADAEISKLAAESAARAQAVTDEARRTVAAEFESAKAREGELSAQLATTLLSRATGVRS